MAVSLQQALQYPGKSRGWPWVGPAGNRSDIVCGHLPMLCLPTTTSGMQVLSDPSLQRLMGLGGNSLEQPMNSVTSGDLRDAQVCTYSSAHVKPGDTAQGVSCLPSCSGLLTATGWKGKHFFVPVLWRKLKLRHRGVTQSRSSSLPGKAGHVTPGQVPGS